ncbi:hypothetical protein [Amycolatopsis sp. NPDC004625]|uniref:hypothetical protein n=1 Tax=Amycolatopsis sp. NPDC004625 TaxID=3154670 RepID=UPI0033A20A78
MMRRHVELEGLRGLTALRELCVSAMPIDDERITAGRVLLTFWQLSLGDRRRHDKYLEHVRDWRGLLHRFLAEGREDGDIVTVTPDEQIIDEIVLLNAGATVMSLVAGEFSTIDLQHRHLESLLDRLTRP